jgi:hypothetical protein
MKKTTMKKTINALVRALNKSRHMGGWMTEAGFWYSDGSRPKCVLIPVGRCWTVAELTTYLAAQ